MILQTWCGSHVDTQNKHWTVYLAWARGWVKAILCFWEYKKWFEIRRRIQSDVPRIIYRVTIPAFLGRGKWRLTKISTDSLWPDHHISIQISAYGIGPWIVVIGKVSMWNMPATIISTPDILSSLDSFTSKLADMIGLKDIASDFLRGFSTVTDKPQPKDTTL